MTGTLVIAVLGLVSGGVGSTLGIVNLRRSLWSSRREGTSEIKVVLREMLQAMNRLEADRNLTPAHVNSISLQAQRRGMVDEMAGLSDRKLRRLVKEADAAFGVAVSHDGADSRQRKSYVDSATKSASDAVDRIDKINRSA